MFRQTWIAVLLLIPLVFAAPALAAGEGQEDLDKATETKLTADAIDDLGEVIRLIESALQKGLDESNAAFANKLLASTFIQRAQITIENLFVNVASMDDFRRRRRFALDDLEKAMKLDPKQPQAFLMIARLNLLPGGEGAIKTREALDKALALDIENPMERAKALVMRAGLQKEPKKKLVDLDEAVRLVPGNAAVVRARGLALADMDKLEPALADLDKAIALAPDDGPTYEAKAIVLARLKKYDEALAALDRAQEINPGSAAPLVQRARVHVAREKPDAALQDLDKALALQPDNVIVLLLRAGIYQELGKKEKALADVDKALEIRPGLIAAIRTRALLLAEDERLDEAVAELEKLRENDPNDLLTLLQLGMIYSVQKESDKAIEAYSTILATQPDLWQALRGRGDAYLNLGKHAEAIADYEKARELEPKDSGILNNLAWVLATSPDDELRDGKRAIRMATEACEATDYKLAHVLSTLAAAYAETGDFDSAVKWATKAVELDDKEHDDEIKKELESYKAKKPWRELLSEEKPGNGNEAELAVPPEKIEGGTPNKMMRRYLLRQVDQAAERWKEDYEKRNTPAEIAAYQKRMRENCLAAIGGLPQWTPLEARVTGTVSRPGYRVEKVLFQSQPKHFVTALLFLPDPGRFEPPYPGVLVPCGHALAAKGHPEYQSMGALLALNGMASLVFDPIDQGERGQYFGEGGWPELWGVKAHLMVGVGCVLLGRNTARFEIWDGMRAIDYLQSRPEVDPRRIGCTGNSGGGTQTSYLMALDDRIHCAAPSCYLTSFPRLLATVGPQDSEQNIFGQLAFGADHADWIMMRAPSPVLICAATKDFFDVGGTWDTFRYAKRLYSRMGFAANVDILENDAEHNYDTLQREGAARWMARWLLSKDQRVVEPKIELLSEEECRCLPDGKVMSLPGARSVYDLNEDYENELAGHRAAAWAKEDKTTLLDRVRQLTGIRKLSELPPPEVEVVGGSTEELPSPPGRGGGGEGFRDEKDPHPNPLPKGEGTYRVEKLLIRPEQGVTLPALLFLPERANSDRVVLYVHQSGKTADANPGGPIEKLVLAGQIVLAVDLRGTGQTQPTPGEYYYYPEELQDAYIAYLLGRSYVGMRAEDILVCARYAAERFAAGRPGSVDLIAVGNVGVPALHAAALEPQLFHSVRIKRSLRAWADIIHRRLSRDQMVNAVHGALAHYDLPDLAATLAEKITIERPVDAMGTAIEDN